MTNIIALSDMTNKFWVTMDSNIEKALFVHLPDKAVKFKQLHNNVYGMNPADPESYITKNQFEKQNKIQMMNVVGDNLRYMSERQQQRAKHARIAFQIIGTPTTQDLKAMLRMNLIKIAKITMEDINLVEKAYGPDVGSIKAKTTRTAPTPAFSNIIEIPSELLHIQEEITLSMDGLTVNSLIFLTAISHDLYYRTG